MATKQKRTGGQVSTNLVYLDLSVILNNYKNPKFWGRKWPIYKSGDLEIYWIMTGIDVRTGTIESEVHANTFEFRRGRFNGTWYDGKWVWDSGGCHSIPIDNPEYSQKVFDNNVLSACIDLIGKIERNFIFGYSGYKKAAQLEDDRDDKLREIAREIADKYVSSGDYSDDIKDAFVEKYATSNKINFTKDVLRKYDHKVLGGQYLMLCSMFGNEKEFEMHREKVGKGENGQTWIALATEAKKIKTEKWANAMREEADKLLKDAL